MNTNDIIDLLTEKSILRDKIFARGFYFTDGSVDDTKYPFYGLWKKEMISGYTLMVAPEQRYYIKTISENSLILIGHAYNPFSIISDENIILQKLVDANTVERFWEEFNELTGVFTLIILFEGEVIVVGDPTCMQTNFYTQLNGHIYVSSHTNCIGDLLNLKWSSYATELVHYKFFGLLGNYMPGDLTQFDEVRRLVPNHYMKIDTSNHLRTKRFYWPEKQRLDKGEITNRAARILKENLVLISQKWNRPAISLTGGCDSKTTLACANGLYDKFNYFSYISSESEKVDAIAAHEICEKLKLGHKIYNISGEDKDFEDIESVRKILFWNSGGIIQSNDNDVRKRIELADSKDFDVEVKSWVSEIGRSYYSKRFNGRKNFGNNPTPRACTTMYKFFLHNRKLVKKTDQVFEEYLHNFFEQHLQNPIEWQDQFFWEFRVSSWNGLVITGEHRYSFDVVIPYNNRMLLELLLSAPLENRIDDTIYKEIRKKMNPAIDATGIAVQNVKHTKNREKLENLYYLFHSNIPF